MPNAEAKGIRLRLSYKPDFEAGLDAVLERLCCKASGGYTVQVYESEVSSAPDAEPWKKPVKITWFPFRRGTGPEWGARFRALILSRSGKVVFVVFYDRLDTFDPRRRHDVLPHNLVAPNPMSSTSTIYMGEPAWRGAFGHDLVNGRPSLQLSKDDFPNTIATVNYSDGRSATVPADGIFPMRTFGGKTDPTEVAGLIHGLLSHHGGILACRHRGFLRGG